MVYITGMNKEVRDVLTGLDADHCLPADMHFDHRMDALQAAIDKWLLEREDGKGEKGVADPKDAVPQPT